MLSQLINIYIDRFDFFLNLTLQHLGICGVALGLALVLGLILGIAVGEFDRSAFWIIGFVNVVYTIPAISMLGFLMPLTGIGNTTAVTALTIYALMPMVRGTYTGLKAIDPAVLEAAEGMGTTKFQMIYRIKLPLALLVILSGLRNTVVMTIALAGIAAFIGAGGLGVAIYRGITTNNPVLTVAGSLLIALLALALDGAVALLEKVIRKKRRLVK